MTHKSIKLLALAVLCGASVIGFAITPRGGKENFMSFVFAVTGIWFILYWYLCWRRQ